MKSFCALRDELMFFWIDYEINTIFAHDDVTTELESRSDVSFKKSLAILFPP